ncbi:MAG: hypothetical protein ACOCRL_00025 [Bacillota bacterium]
MDFLKEMFDSKVIRICIYIVSAYLIGYALGSLHSHIQHTFF